MTASSSAPECDKFNGGVICTSRRRWSGTFSSKGLLVQLTASLPCSLWQEIDRDSVKVLKGKHPYMSTLLFPIKLGALAWKQALHLRLTPLRSLSALTAGSVGPFPLGLSPERRSHSSRHLFSLESLLNPSVPELGRGRRREVREEKERLASLLLSPDSTYVPPQGRYSQRTAGLDIYNELLIDWLCANVPAPNGKLTQLVGCNVLKLLSVQCVACDVLTVSVGWLLHMRIYRKKWACVTNMKNWSNYVLYTLKFNIQ